MPAKTSRQRTGQQGETLAAEYLKQKGYAIVTTNWRCREGELDIIARQGASLVFIEVRTRRAENNEAAFASILPNKQKRLIAAIHCYLNQHDLETSDWRLDVIGVALRQSSPLIEHVEDALDW
jgi:putative endonuclease